MSEKSYVGKIGNTGAQAVKAPYPVSKKGGKGVVKKGEDLRNGNKKK